MISIKNKRGQIAIAVIIAILIVAIILIVFGVGRRPSVEVTAETNPQAFVEKCTRDATEEAIELLLPQGGFIEPEDFKLYNDIKISYLCKHRGHYRPCINQHPMFLNEIKREIANHVQPQVEQCLLNLKSELEKRQYEVGLYRVNTSVSLGPDRVITAITGRVTIAKGEETRGFERIEAEVKNPLYDLASIAMSIANSEAIYCYFEYVGYMSLYPRFQIKKTSVSDSTSIYTIIDRESDKEMNIAIRGCVIPAGI
jgi:hypothetical protein